MRRSEGAFTQIALLVVVNAFVGGMVGIERALLPIVAERDFGVAGAAAATSFIVTFGLAKAFTNLGAGRLADRYGRKHVLLAGWLVGVPVPLVLLYADSWSWIVAANALLGVNQGLAWSMTLNLKLDHAPADRRGLVVGLNEAAGYVGVALLAFLTGLFATRDAAAGLGLLLALGGLLLSAVARDAHREPPPRGSFRSAFRDPALAAPSFAGLATNLKDGALWGLLPLVLLSRGADLATTGLVVAAYPIAWGLGQLLVGPLADRVDKRALAVVGLGVQGVGVALLAWRPGVAAALVVGAGTALAYPTLLALVADRSAPSTRATSLGVYRFWRDLGYAIGALGTGILADAAGFGTALAVVAALLVIAAIVLGAAREVRRERAST